MFGLSVQRMAPEIVELEMILNKHGPRIPKRRREAAPWQPVVACLLILGLCVSGSPVPAGQDEPGLSETTTETSADSAEDEEMDAYEKLFAKWMVLLTPDFAPDLPAGDMFLDRRFDAPSHEELTGNDENDRIVSPPRLPPRPSESGGRDTGDGQR